MRRPGTSRMRDHAVCCPSPQRLSSSCLHLCRRHLGRGPPPSRPAQTTGLTARCWHGQGWWQAETSCIHLHHTPPLRGWPVQGRRAPLAGRDVVQHGHQHALRSRQHRQRVRRPPPAARGRRAAHRCDLPAHLLRGSRPRRRRAFRTAALAAPAPRRPLPGHRLRSGFHRCRHASGRPRCAPAPTQMILMHALAASICLCRHHSTRPAPFRRALVCCLLSEGRVSGACLKQGGVLQASQRRCWRTARRF